ncbi:voltage-gated ClC-type chloride channel ClcB [mine drainage metagenome]|uniref:Voltage-gated ClC-type chloride channel ClcB n=1 Tax=mine drainage metagenome TaxID=410659 RepID=A0A1J5PHW4_9ZZZZ
MGSLLAATTHAPAMSAIMVFEVTRNYNVVLAAMPACVVASVLGSLLRERSVYAEALGLKEDGAPGRTSLFGAITGRHPRSAPAPGQGPEQPRL